MADKGRISGETANATYLTIGRGKVFFNPEVSGNLQGSRFLGNCPAFKLAVADTVLEHFSSQAGLKVQDKLVVIDSTLTASFTLQEINQENLALFLKGTLASTGAIGASSVAPTTGVKNFMPKDRGKWFPLRASSTGSTAGDNGDVYGGQLGTSATVGRRLTNISNVVVDGGDTPVYTVNTHYKVDALNGLLYVTEASTIPRFGSTAIRVAFTYAAQTQSYVNLLQNPTFRGELRFEGENASENPVTKFEFIMNRCNIAPEGEAGLLSDDWVGLNFTAQAEAATTVDANSPTATFRWVF